MFIWILVLLVLFILIQRNNKRNMEKLRNSRSRGFKKSYYDRKSERRNPKKDKNSSSDENEITITQNKNTTP